MRINHNISAINTYRNQLQNTKTVENSINKLSSGLKINQAADDSAGLAISEKMRAQIRGLERAEQNIQDGISLIQTAEAGLAEIANPNLIRLRELAIQAANDTLTNTDRAMIQKEVEQIKNGIDDIANNTKFNDIFLLNVPDIGEIEEIENIASTEKIVTVKKGERVVAGYVEIPNPPNPSTFEITAFFGTPSGASWPDMNIVSPNGEKFGFNEALLNGSSYQEDTQNTSSTKAIYSGYGATDETFKFENPISGKWIIEIRHDGGDSSSTFSLKSNYLIHGGDSTTTTTDIHKKDPNLTLQVGANTGNTFLIDLTDARTKALGINEISVETRLKADEAIELIDKAIQLVSSERTKYGAYQNSLEHVGANVKNYIENLVSAESRIRDLDVAQEITKLTNNQTILQSAQAMMAQANQISQGILQLLK